MFFGWMKLLGCSFWVSSLSLSQGVSLYLSSLPFFVYNTDVSMLWCSAINPCSRFTTTGSITVGTWTQCLEFTYTGQGWWSTGTSNARLVLGTRRLISFTVFHQFRTLQVLSRRPHFWGPLVLSSASVQRNIEVSRAEIIGIGTRSTSWDF